MARNKRIRPHDQSRSRTFALLSVFRGRGLADVLARLRGRPFKAVVARQSTQLLATSLAGGGRKSVDDLKIDHSTLSVADESKYSGSESPIRRRRRKSSRNKLEVSRNGNNAQKPLHQPRWPSMFSGWRNGSPIEPKNARAGKVSKDRKDGQELSCGPPSYNSGGTKSHRSSSRSLSIIRDGVLGYPGDDGWVPHAPDLDLHLPQSADDDTISKAVRSLFFYVAQHVGNYYINRSYDFIPDRLAVAQLEKLHLSLPDYQTVDEVLEDTPYQQVVIEHCLNFLLLSSISMEFLVHERSNRERDDFPSYPLLPADFTAVLKATARTSAGPDNIKCYDQALSKLRVLTSYIVPDIANDEMYRRQKEEMISMAASAFGQAFSPWENPDNEPGARLINLKLIFHKAADLGLLMFSQASTFRFDWKPGEVGMKPDEIATSPELLKVGDENGLALPRAQKMVRMKVSALRFVRKVDGGTDTGTSTEVQREAAPDPNQGSYWKRRGLKKAVQATQNTELLEEAASRSRAQYYETTQLGDDAYGMSRTSFKQSSRPMQRWGEWTASPTDLSYHCRT